MKINRMHLFLLTGILLIIGAACGFSASTAKISAANTARMVGSSYENTTTFEQDEAFYLLVTLANAPDDTVTKAVWIAANAEGLAKNTKMDEAEFESGEQEITFDLSNSSAWPVGEYKVELYLNDKLDRTLEFTVEGSPTAANIANSSTSVSIVNAITAREIDGKFESTAVYSSDEAFHCIVELSQVSPSTKLKAEWKAVATDGYDANFSLYINEGNPVINEVRFDLANPNPWPKGKYSVELYLDDQYQGIIEFEVE